MTARRILGALLTGTVSGLGIALWGWYFLLSCMILGALFIAWARSGEDLE